MTGTVAGTTEDMSEELCRKELSLLELWDPHHGLFLGGGRKRERASERELCPLLNE